MQKQSLKTTFIFLLSAVLSLLGSAVTFFYFFGKTAAKPQIFHDIIIENVATHGMNKTGELHLFYGVLLLGCILFLIIYPLMSFLVTRLSQISHNSPEKRKSSASVGSSDISSSPWKKNAFLFVLILLPLLARLIIYGKLSVTLLFLCAITVIGHFVWKDYVLEIVTLYLFTYYAFVAIFTLLCPITSIDAVAVTSEKLYFMTLMTATVFLLTCRIYKSISLLKMELVLLQLVFPFMLFIYFVDDYFYRGEMIQIPYAKGYTLFFALLCLFSFILLIRHVILCFQKQKQLKAQKTPVFLPLKTIICRITPILLFVYNSFSAAPMYAQPDQHHHGEQMIPWQEVVTLSQKLYDEYTPVSGLFPFFSGGIQNVLLNGTISDYSPAISISMVIFCMITMYLITEHVGTVWGLAFSVLFCLPCYNRQYFVLPVLLLLFLPKLMQKQNLWLKCWLLSCFLAGLYYPLFGGALVIGTLPLGIYQIYRLIKNGELKTLVKKPSFYLSWALCLLPVLLCIPLLLKMLKHTLTYSSQTILADGISLFGQDIPERFMTYLSNDRLRYYCYFGLRFLLPAIGIWLFVCLLYHVLISCFGKKVTFTDETASERETNRSFKITPAILSLLAGILTLLVSYSYTLVRADTGMILSRTSYILVAVVGMFLPVILLKFFKEHLPKSLSCLIIGFCFSLPMILYYETADLKRPAMWVYPNGESALFLDDGAKIYEYYDVHEIFVRSYDSGLTEEQINTLGPGFMVSDQLDYVTEYGRIMELCNKVNPDMTYLGIGGQGFYYYTNAKACGTGFIEAAKGYEAQKALLQVIEEKRPVVFQIDPKSSYYIYYYLLTHDYIYSEEDNVLYPVEIYDGIYAKESTDAEGDTSDLKAGDDYRKTCETTDFNLVAASFGRSMDSLLPLMTPMTDQINDGNFAPFKGSDYDMMTAALNEETATKLQSLTVNFKFRQKIKGTERADCSVTCTLNGDKLLIPMGMNACWLLSDITQITFEGTDITGHPVALSDDDLTFKLYSIRK